MNALKTRRITSIDLLRGLVMIIMALDHTREYFNKQAFQFNPLDLDKTTPILFFTRWITHFCAPTFILLAGTSAFLSGQRKTKKQSAAFLVKRGLWLVFLELTVVNFSWFFNIHFSFLLLAVIWTLGICMIALAGLIFLPRNAMIVIGILLIAGHNLLDNIHFPQNDFMGFLWGFLHDPKMFFIGKESMLMGYPILPWIGVMTLGYCLGSLYKSDFDTAKRKRILLSLGTGALILFVIVRAINVYGNVAPWAGRPTFISSFLSFINVTKYPPSLDYVLITNGAALIFLALTENAVGRFSKFISVYGRVPMFYYILHIYLIHITALVAMAVSGQRWTDMTNLDNWVNDTTGRFQGYGYSLGVVYLIWISVVLILYPLCKRYDLYKSSHKDKWWLSYL